MVNKIICEHNFQIHNAIGAVLCTAQVYLSLKYTNKGKFCKKGRISTTEGNSILHNLVITNFVLPKRQKNLLHTVLEVFM